MHTNKNYFLGVSLLTLAVASSAFGDFPLLSKRETSGTVAPAYQHSRKCDVYEDKVVVTTDAGIGPSVVTTTAATLSNAVTHAIADALKGKTTSKRTGLVGGGNSTWTVTDHAGKEATLKSTGHVEVVNDSTAAATLVILLDKVCR